MTGAGKPTCGTCRWWFDRSARYAEPGEERTPDEYDRGECRRHAPRPQGSYEHRESWPSTERGEWCGEYRPKPSATPQGGERG